MSDIEITQNYLKQLLKYDHETGELIRLECKQRPDRVGKTACGYHNCGYYFVSLNNKRYLAHRLIWFYVYGVWPEFIDHKNGDRKDNRLLNLRSVSRKINNENRQFCKGVTPIRNKWRARIQVGGKQLLLGHFDNYEDACLVYMNAKIKYHKGYEQRDKRTTC